MAERELKKFPPPVDWDELYPGRFIKAADLKGKKVTLTIAAVKLEELQGDKGIQVKGIIAFDKTDKEWALNKTNGICLKRMFGKKVQDWKGHKVTLFPTLWNDDDCIRVWGSPELEADIELPVQLPRRRPFNMTLHRVEPPPPKGAPAPAATTQPDPPTSSEAPAGALGDPPAI